MFSAEKEQQQNEHELFNSITNKKKLRIRTRHITQEKKELVPLIRENKKVLSRLQ